ncbi:hypothetical protein VitviT2T_004068 [Vitis vinifera]|uniref:Sec39 domain-containing protein n=2 Tax=Vitis vinifera TaxID=29760 RepID=A0ABY9BNE3_VITVI|nr:hypothetical protein VitviT2T_004068 [Vitis vinifera]
MCLASYSLRESFSSSVYGVVLKYGFKQEVIWFTCGRIRRLGCLLLDVFLQFVSKAKECLKLFPDGRNVKVEADVIDAFTVKLPELGVTLLPMQFRQIKDPMEIIKKTITSRTGAYLQVDELIEIAKLLGLNSQDDVSAVEEAIARKVVVAGDLQLAFDLCLSLAKKGHGPIWDLCVVIARGPTLENMDINSQKQLLGFALNHCDEESIGERLHAWKDLDTQG